jgi:hypothetical protein
MLQPSLFSHSREALGSVAATVVKAEVSRTTRLRPQQQLGVVGCCSEHLLWCRQPKQSVGLAAPAHQDQEALTTLLTRFPPLLLLQACQATPSTQQQFLQQ